MADGTGMTFDPEIGAAACEGAHFAPRLLADALHHGVAQKDRVDLSHRHPGAPSSSSTEASDTAKSNGAAAAAAADETNRTC